MKIKPVKAWACTTKRGVLVSYTACPTKDQAASMAYRGGSVIRVLITPITKKRKKKA